MNIFVLVPDRARAIWYQVFAANALPMILSALLV
jgi:hypothetical protein